MTSSGSKATSVLEAMAKIQRPHQQMLEMQSVVDKAGGAGGIRSLQDVLGRHGGALNLAATQSDPLARWTKGPLTAAWLDDVGAMRYDEVVGSVKGIDQLSAATMPRYAIQLPETFLQAADVDRTSLLGSAVLGEKVLASAQLTGRLADLLDGARFDALKIFGAERAIDASAVLLGSELTEKLIDLEPAWHRHFDGFGIEDITGPVVVDGKATVSIFPPDLIEERPLQSEFEVDAIVAESQEEAQIFLALRSEIAAQRMASARQRLEEGDEEALSQSMLSCRRALQALADDVFPARSGTVKGRDGEERAVGNDQYKNRLMASMDEGIPSETSRTFALCQLELTAGLVDALLVEIHKGVHADIVRAQAKQAYTQTWFFIAQIARSVS